MKRFAVIFLSVAMCTSLMAGCSSSGSSDSGDSGDMGTETSETSLGLHAGDSDMHVALLCPNMGLDYYRQVGYGIAQASEDYNCDVTIFSGIDSVDAQLNAVEDAIQLGVDGIILSPLDSYGIASAVDACLEAGVSLISQADIYGADQNATSVMTTDNVWMGQVIAESVVEDFGGDANVLVLLNAPGVSNSEEKYEGMMSVFDQHSGITVLDALDSCTQLADAQNKVADAVQLYTDTIDAVVCINEQAALGAMNSLEEYGYTCGDDVILYSLNYATEIDGHIADGTIRTGVYSWGNLFGYWSVEMILRDQAGMPVPQRISLPADFVTVDNVDRFSPMSTTAREFDFDAYTTS